MRSLISLFLILSVVLYSTRAKAVPETVDNKDEERPTCKIPNQIYKPCGSSCDYLCPGTPTLVECNLECKPGCYCKEGMIEVDEVCVDKKEYCS